MTNALLKFFQGCIELCTKLFKISCLLWGLSLAQSPGKYFANSNCQLLKNILYAKMETIVFVTEPCTVTNSDSFLIVNVVESQGSQISQGTDPAELPLSGTG